MNITIHSRKSTEKILKTGFPRNKAVISFCDPPDSPRALAPIDYSCKAERVFTVAIHDIDISVLPKYDLTYDTYFPEADDLAKFIYSAKEDGLDIMCQCEYGESRSAACAAAIREHFYRDGISVFADYMYYPNQLVYNKLICALEDYSFSILTGEQSITDDDAFEISVLEMKRGPYSSSALIYDKTNVTRKNAARPLWSDIGRPDNISGIVVFDTDVTWEDIPDIRSKSLIFGNFLSGSATVKGITFSDKSCSLAVIEADSDSLMGIARYLCTKSARKTVLLKDYNVREMLLVQQTKGGHKQ